MSRPLFKNPGVFKNHFFQLILALGPCTAAHAQPAGCTDPQAQNFDAAATQNDGSCLYPTTVYDAPVKATLADTLAENSGLVAAGGRWWTLNDSGNDDTFFRFNPETGAVNQYVKLKQAKNEDWEDIATDGQNLYIGDFGNNAAGNRTDLGLYRVPLAQIGSGTTTSVEAGEYAFLPFAYEDQTDFAPVNDEDDLVFDCEAMLFSGSQIHLFSKNWKAKTCAHYALDPGAALARRVETFDAQGLVTSAALSPDGKLVALLVYNKSPVPEVYVWLLWDFRDGRFFNGHKRRIELGSPLSLGKSEAIAFSGLRRGYIGNEFLELGGITLVPQQTRTFDFSAYVPETVGVENPPGDLGTKFWLSPNPFSDAVRPQFAAGETPGFLRVKNAAGQFFFEGKNPPGFLETQNWPAGTYIFEAGLRGKTWVAKAVKQ